ncbi:MAG: hypothetical protein J6U04_02995 [Salinivirgaceae bacterium]|nr:hypothetical protein [Salinivirgaceae bacterium]
MVRFGTIMIRAELVDKQALNKKMVDKAIFSRENGRYLLFMADKRVVTS